MFSYSILASQLSKSTDQNDLDLVLPETCLGLWKNNVPLFAHKGIGSNWVSKLSSEDREVFSWIGRAHAEFGKIGGTIRAKSAKRDSRGRFVKDDK